MPHTQTRPQPGDTLDCGHTCPAKYGVGTGYGLDNGGRTYCYPCCAKQDQEDIREGKPQFLYRSADKPSVLTNWPGTALMRVLWAEETPHNIGGTILRIRARDDYGRDWYGTGPGKHGNGEYVRLRRCKTTLPAK